MKLTAIKISLLSTVFLVGACANQNEVTNTQTPPVASSPAMKTSAPPDGLAVARAAFQKDCASCHQPDASGGPVTIDGEKMSVPTLREGHALKDSDEDFVKQIIDGGDGMPAFKDKMTPEQINDLVRFIRKEFQEK